MKQPPKKLLRCAVYTRKSTDHNLELEFNSLDAQREACEAYIKSQAHEGWRLIPTKYDDGGHSGASLERPALQKLLADVSAGKVDVIVVYKIDRLTRSLTDFAKLVEVFDGESVSFVSITQSFNTTTSMGRLTLNVLLSFAQFEREVIGERVRDKIAASKKKGIWVGGPVPLGYQSKDKKLSVLPEEAETVRMLFERYLALKSIGALQQELDRKNIRTKKQTLSSGKTRGGCRFGKGTLRHLLTNRFFIGEVVYKGSVNRGEHEPIVDRKTFNAVQRLLSENTIKHKSSYQSSNAILQGLLYDDRGNRMSPSYSRKNGARYRYYVSQALLQSLKAEAGSVTRVPAAEIEKAAVDALKQHRLLGKKSEEIGAELLKEIVERIEIHEDALTFTLFDKSIEDDGHLTIPWRRKALSAQKGLLHAPEGATRKLSPNTRDALLSAISKARKWVSALESGELRSIAEIAEREGNVERHIRLLLPLAFASPAIVLGLINGSSVSGMTITGLAKQITPVWFGSRPTLLD